MLKFAVKLVLTQFQITITMKKISKFKIFMPLIAAAALTFSCSSDDSVFTNPTDDKGDPIEVKNKLIVTEAGTDDVRKLNIESSELSVPVSVKFTTETNSMKRLYITSNTNGLGDEPYTFENPDVDSKKDGSVDLPPNKNNEFEYLINFPTPVDVDNSTIVYTLWTTTGRGDFRDTAKRNSFITKDQTETVVGTITIKKGTGGTSSSESVRELKDIKLFAPLGDGTSKTFTSMYNGAVYEISTGEETAALWDFGYYYGVTNKASLSSTSSYPTNIIDVPTISKVPADQLNKCYLGLSSKTAAQFTAITLDSELDAITQSSEQAIKNLNKDDIIEFVDQYGNKGLIHVKELKAGDGDGDYILIDMKLVN